MALTWTRFIPDHYDNAAKSPPSLGDTVGGPSFPFMRLSAEIRLKVYKDYLIDRYSLQPQKSMKCKAVNAEVQDFLQNENTFTLRICWQDAGFDGLATSCFQASGERLDYDRIPHLRIEIYPPHHDQPIDMVRTWRHVHRLCSDLEEASWVQHLSLHFMENEYATWEAAGEPCETMDVSYSSDRVPSDVLHILDLFRLLTNVTKAQIHLPVSLTKDVGLQISKQDTEDVMMKVRSLDDGHKKLVVKTLEEAIAKSEENLKYGTGSFSQDKLNELCGYGHWIFKPHLDIFEYIWPHRDCIYKWEYRSPFRYIGDEDLIGAPLDYVDPYDSDDYYS